MMKINVIRDGKADTVLSPFKVIAQAVHDGTTCVLSYGIEINFSAELNL